MGVSTEVRRMWRVQYHRAWGVTDPSYTLHQDPMLAENAGGCSAVRPRPAVVFFDYTNKLKIPPAATITTGIAYIRYCILPEIEEAYKNGATTVHVCFDRGSPPNKAAEHKRRRAKIIPMLVDAAPQVDHATLPEKEDWSSYIITKRLTLELLHYITHSLMDREGEEFAIKNKFAYRPPRKCQLFIHGGVWHLPTREQAAHMPQRAPPVVYYVHHQETIEEREDGSTFFKSHVVAGEVSRDLFPEQNVSNLLEGEMACLYYATFYPQHTCLVVTPDGDLIPQMLQMARDRIDPVSGNFRNVHLIHLNSTGNGGEMIDVNQLYIEMMQDHRMRKMGVTTPELAHSALSSLVKNDYIHDFMPGVAFYTIPVAETGRKGDKISYILKAFYAGGNKYARLFTLTSPLPGDVRAPRQPCIDEELFITLVHHAYVEKYYDTAIRQQKKQQQKRKRKRTANAKLQVKRRRLDTAGAHASMGNDAPAKGEPADETPEEEELVEYDSELTLEQRIAIVRAHTSKFKQISHHMMSVRRIRVFCRQLLWVLEYWYNNYRGTGNYQSSTAKYRDLSSCGWDVRAGTIMPAKLVSVYRPSQMSFCADAATLTTVPIDTIDYVSMADLFDAGDTTPRCPTTPRPSMMTSVQ